MARVANLLNRAAPVVGGVLDFNAAKEQGKDNFGAAVSATGSGLGGWAGGVKGAALGTALGGPVGGVIGGIGGGILGSIGGSSAASAVDGLVRGNKANASTGNNMRQVQLQDGSIVEVDDDGNILGVLFAGTGLAVAGNTARRVYQQGINPMQTYQGYQGMNNAINPVGRGATNNIAAAQSTIKTVGSQVGAGIRQSADDFINLARRVPGGKYAATAAGLALLDQITGGNVARGAGRAIAGGADMLTGNQFDFDGKNTPAQQAQRQGQRQINNQQNFERNRDIYNPFDDEKIRRRNEGLALAADRLDFEYERGLRDNIAIAERADEIQRRNALTEFTANQASDLLQGYMSSIPNSVANSLRGVMSARYN